MSKFFEFSIAISLFIITFLNYPTRIDDAVKAATEFDPLLVGDLVLVSGAAIVVGVVAGIKSAFSK